MRLALIALAILFAFPAIAAENRCGWFVNPTPANAWLNDAEGQWTISSQGSEGAEGDWPEISEWIATNGSYGYGCACMKVTTDRRNQRILVIHSSRGLPLAKCKNDPALNQASEPNEPPGHRRVN